MIKRTALFALVLSVAATTAGCGGSDDVFGDLEPVRAIGELDSQGRPYLSPWDVDPAVADLQQQAVDAGLPVEVSGVYDDETLAIILAFQYSQGLVPDGVVGPNTWDALADPQELPEDVDALTLVEIATVSINSPSDALQILDDLGLPPPVAAGNSAPDLGLESGVDADSEPGNDDGNEGRPATPPSSGATISAVIHLSNQQMELLDADGTVLHQFPISSGRDGLTPVGSFAVQSKAEMATSSSDYPNITMPWMTRFNGGIGFHGIPVKDGNQLDTPLGVAPVSAGCIRMADADAKIVYDTLPVGARVSVAS